MATYTYGSTPEEVIAEALPHKYEMSLNRTDMLALLWALGEEGTLEEALRHTPVAADLRTSILSTLGIEEI